MSKPILTIAAAVLLGRQPTAVELDRYWRALHQLAPDERLRVPVYGRTVVDIGEIARLRLEGHSQREIARAVGCSQPYVCKVLSGQILDGDAALGVITDCP